MLKIDLSKAICTITESMFNRKCLKEKILLFELEVKNFKTNTGTSKIIAIQRPSNYVKVFELTQNFVELEEPFSN